MEIEADAKQMLIKRQRVRKKIITVSTQIINSPTTQGTKKPFSLEEMDAKGSTVDKPTITIKEEPSVMDPSVEESGIEEPSVEEPSADLEEPSIDDPLLEEGSSGHLLSWKQGRS